MISHTFTVDAQTTALLQEVAATNRYTLSSLLFAVCAVMVADLTGEDDVAISTSIIDKGGRRLDLPISLAISVEASLADVILLAQLAMAKGDNGRRIYDMPNREGPPCGGWAAARRASVTIDSAKSGLNYTEIASDRKAQVSDLNFSLSTGDALIFGFLECNEALFDIATIDRWLQTLEWLFGRFATALECKARGLVAESPAEIRARDNFARGHRTSDEHYTSVLRRIIYAANRCPDSVAASDGTSQISYKDIVDSAVAFAEVLTLEIKADEESVVAICIRRSTELVTAMLSVLAAGYAFLIIDPDLPPARIGQMMSGAAATAMVVMPGEHAYARESAAVPIVQFESHLKTAMVKLHEPLKSALAYVVFTSGSTGVPKATAIEHGALANLVAWHCDDFAVSADDVVMQVASSSFDAFVWDVFSALCGGAHLKIISDSVRLDFDLLQQELAMATIAFFPTPLAHELFAVADNRSFGGLRLLLVGGDTLRLLPSANDTLRIVNAYGPTECAVVSTSTSDSMRPELKTRSIGRPIANVSAYILDEKLRGVPIGLPGELYIGGANVGRGYLNDMDATRKSFLPDPFSSATDARMYRTGDYCRFAPDGQIEFLGRLDRQVKMRGYRVELSEIEAVIAREPGVAAVAVVCDEQKEFLVAFYVPTADAANNTGARIDEVVRKSLPSYMTPEALIKTESLPLLASGKLDYRSLGEQATLESRRNTSSGGAMSASERLIADAWLQVLGYEPNREDDFFKRGGNSLTAVRFIAELRRRTGRSLRLRTLFDYPTVTEIANIFDRENT